MKGVNEDDTGGVAGHEDFELIEADWVVDVFIGDVEEEIIVLGEPGLGVAGGDDFFGRVVEADVTDGAPGELDAGEGDAVDDGVCKCQGDGGFADFGSTGEEDEGVWVEECGGGGTLEVLEVGVGEVEEGTFHS